MKTIFLIVGRAGEYEGKSWWVVCALDEKSKAQSFVESLQYSNQERSQQLRDAWAHYYASDELDFPEFKTDERDPNGEQDSSYTVEETFLL